MNRWNLADRAERRAERVAKREKMRRDLARPGMNTAKVMRSLRRAGWSLAVTLGAYVAAVWCVLALNRDWSPPGGR